MRRAPGTPPDTAGYARRWAERVLRPGPLTAGERAAVERAVGRCYLAAGMRRPATVVWCTRPEEAERLGTSAQARADLLLAARPSLRHRLRARRLVDPLAGLLLGAVIWAWTAAVATAALLPLYGAAPLLGLLALAIAVAARVARRMPAGRPAPVRALPGVALLAVAAAVTVAVVRVPTLLTIDVSTGASDLVFAAMPVTVPAGTVVGAVRGLLRGRARAAGRRERLVERVTHVIDGGAARWRRGLPDVGPAGRAEVLAGTASPAALALYLSRPVQPPALAVWALRRTLAAGSLRPRWPGTVLTAHEQAARAPWQAYRRMAVALEPPREIHAGPGGPHRMDGPAVIWADGTPWYYLHGVRVPRCPADAHWTLEEILQVDNSEVRRVMIEQIGWDTYLRLAEPELIADVPDPANPPHRLVLYQLSPPHQEGRLLLMTNGSPDRSGRLRRYAEFVPEALDDPVEAAAWQYGVPVEIYRALERRT